MKTVIKALLAASMLMPIAAQAQEQDGRERGEGRRGDWSQRGPRAERSAEVGIDAQVRAERPQRGEFRAERPQPAPQFRQDAPSPDRQVLDTGNRNRGGFDGGRRGDQRDDTRRDEARRDDSRNDRPDRREDWRQALRPDDGRFGNRQPTYGQNRPDFGRDRDVQNRDWRGGDRRGWNDGSRGWADNRGRIDNRNGAWNRGWRNDSRYDWNRYRQVNRGAYRLPRYYAPSGWGYGYRRFSVGVSLSSILFNRNYWIDDPFNYRLPEAYGPYRWVRYYNDALLVDIRSGQVVDSVYGIFY